MRVELSINSRENVVSQILIIFGFSIWQYIFFKEITTTSLSEIFLIIGLNDEDGSVRE